MRKIDFTPVRLVTVRDAGELDMRDMRKEKPGSPAQISTHDLEVIPIELNLQPRMVQVRENVCCLLNCPQKIAWNIPIVYWFQRDHPTRTGGLIECETETSQISCMRLCGIDLRRDSSHYM